MMQLEMQILLSNQEILFYFRIELVPSWKAMIAVVFLPLAVELGQRWRRSIPPQPLVKAIPAMERKKSPFASLLFIFFPWLFNIPLRKRRSRSQQFLFDPNEKLIKVYVGKTTSWRLRIQDGGFFRIQFRTFCRLHNNGLFEDITWPLEPNPI